MRENKRPRIEKDSTEKKVYRLMNPSVFNLKVRSAFYLAQETDFGYRIMITGRTWIGMPKFCVENNKLFRRFFPKPQINKNSEPITIKNY
jgi:hypothetical protein